MGMGTDGDWSGRFRSREGVRTRVRGGTVGWVTYGELREGAC